MAQYGGRALSWDKLDLRGQAEGADGVIGFLGLVINLDDHAKSTTSPTAYT